VRRLVLLTVLATTLLGAASARAETTLYVVDQPELFFVAEVKGEALYAAYLEAESLCYGAGSHWYEGPTAVTHRAFETGPVKLRPVDGGYRLLRRHSDLYESSREELRLQIRPDGIAGTYLAENSGEAIQGSCETNAPGFEPESGAQSEPPIGFEARRYVPLGSPAATDPDPAAEALYFRSTRQLEILLWTSESAVTKVRGAARQTCFNRRHGRSALREPLEPVAPFPIGAADGRFDVRAGQDFPSTNAASHLEGWVGSGSVLGRYRAAIASRNGPRNRFYEWCRTGGSKGDGYVGFEAFRYVPAVAAATR
jgi:hypothetical protein